MIAMTTSSSTSVNPAARARRPLAFPFAMEIPFTRLSGPDDVDNRDKKYYEKVDKLVGSITADIRTRQPLSGWEISLKLFGLSNRYVAEPPGTSRALR